VFRSVCRGHLAVIKAFLADGWDPSKYDNEAIYIAAAKGHKQVVQFLLHDKRVNPTPALRVAVELGDDVLVEMLLGDGRADLLESDALPLAVFYNHDGLVQRLLQDKRYDGMNEHVLALAEYAKQNAYAKVHAHLFEWVKRQKRKARFLSTL
jgi:ankyrin repeat protein